MKNVLLLLVLITGTLCAAQSVKEVDAYSKIMIYADAEVEVINSPKNQVVFNVDESLLENFTITSNNGMLVIKQNSETIPGLRIRLYSNRLQALAVKGNCQVNLRDFVSEERLTIQVSEGATVNTGDTRIAHLNVIKSDDSQVTAVNAKETTETINNG